MKTGLVLLAALAVISAAQGVSVAPGELAATHRWVTVKFGGQALPPPAEPGLYVLANHGVVQRNARGGQPMRAGDTAFTRGLYCHAPSKLIVRLPGPGSAFDAWVAVDSNDQTRGGRGSVEFRVRVAEGDAFRSGLRREGMPAQRVQVELAGAREFALEVGDGGDGIACDQADWLDACVTLRDGAQVWLGDLPLIDAAADAVGPELPFSFRYGGRFAAELVAAWPVQRSQRQVHPQKTEHILRAADPDSGLEVRCVAVEYHDFPVVEWTLHFTNRAATDTEILEEVQALDLAWDRRSDGEFVLHHHAGDDCSPHSYAPRQTTLAPGTDLRFASAGGRPTTGAFPYFNLARPGAGWIAAIGWPGQWAARFQRDGGTGLHLQAGQERTHFRLRPGETARSPLVALLFWQGDRERAQNLWRRWMLAHNLPRTADGQLPPPILSSCSGGFFPGLKCNEADECRFIDVFTRERVPLNYWWMDAGWCPCDDGWPKVGTWQPDPARFPRGLRPVADHAHARGLKLIVWFEPERVSPGTWLDAQPPEWLLGKAGETRLLNLGHPPARRWLADHVDRLLTEQGIDLYRQDFNLDPLAYWRAHDPPDRQGLTEIHHVEGYLAYWDELRRRHPGLLIDSCASGGRRNDLETLRRAVPLLRSDYQSFQGDPAFATGNQGHTYGLASWIPYFGQGVYYNPDQLAYNVRSHFSPAFGFCCDVRQPGADWARIRALAEEWQQLAPLFLGDYHPLTPYRLDDDVWLAWQFDRPAEGDGMVQVFRRPRSAYEAARFALRGLVPEATYRIRTTDHPSATQEFSGRELIQRGVPVVLSNAPSAQVLVYRRLP